MLMQLNQHTTYLKKVKLIHDITIICNALRLTGSFYMATQLYLSTIASL